MSIPSVFWGIKNVCFICVDFFVPYVSKFLSGNTAPHMRRIFMRQLSRPDKSGNSRFEYTKILNTTHAGTLSGLTSLRTKCFICVQFSRPKKLTEYLNAICVNFPPAPKNRWALLSFKQRLKNIMNFTNIISYKKNL